MFSLSRLKVRGRIVAGFLLVFALVGAGSGVGVWKVAELGGLVDELVGNHAEKLIQTMVWERYVAVNVYRSRVELLTADPAAVAKMRADGDEASRIVGDLQKKIEASAADADDKEALAVIAEKRARYRELRETLRRRHDDGETIAVEVNGPLEEAGQAYIAALERFVAMNRADLAAGKASAEVAVKRARLLVLALVAIGFVASLVAAALITQSIVKPLQRAQADALRMASGDLTQAIDSTGNDEIADLMRSAARMQDSLREIASAVRESSEAVASAASQIAAASSDLSSRTEEQASSLEETAASIEEMAANVGQTAQNAQQADALATAAAEVARRGGKAVDEVVQMMGSIQSASRKIGDIIGVIDAIAFQTNILALNAAVEAARAGDQGRGFAVVAAEVRSLAQRSAEAAREIKALITHSVAQVDAGAALAGDAGSTMGDVVESVNRVSKIIGDIAGAAVEQSSGIAQVNQAVADLDKVTQQNAALVEESNAAGESLKVLSGGLVTAVSVFQLPSARTSALAAHSARLEGAPRLSPPPRTVAPAPVSTTPRRPRLDDEWTQF